MLNFSSAILSLDPPNLSTHLTYYS